jgi:putative transposase
VVAAAPASASAPCPSAPKSILVVVPSNTSTLEVLRRPFESAQYTSLRYTDRLDELGIDPSVGSTGDAYDNAMAEAFVGTFKAELVAGRRFPSFEAAEHETLQWISFYNRERLHEQLGDIPPVEFEERFRQTHNGSFGAVEPDRPALVEGAPVGLGARVSAT